MSTHESFAAAIHWRSCLTTRPTSGSAGERPPATRHRTPLSMENKMAGEVKARLSTSGRHLEPLAYASRLRHRYTLTWSSCSLYARIANTIGMRGTASPPYCYCRCRLPTRLAPPPGPRIFYLHRHPGHLRAGQRNHQERKSADAPARAFLLPLAALLLAKSC